MWRTKGRSEDDFHKEIEAHIALETDRLIAEGADPVEARAEAHRRFGNVTAAQERYFESRRMMWFDDARADVRYAFRTLLKTPGFTAVAVLTLALGIGANTAIFSVIDGVVLTPLPYQNGARLVLVRQSAPLAGQPDVGVSVRELYDYRDQASSFDAVVEYHQMNFDLLRRGDPDRVNTGVVSHTFFDTLGIEPILGRTFVAGDDAPGAEAVLILSYSYWQSKFGGDPTIVGQVFEMNDRPHTVIGVLPNVPHYPQENDVYMPVSACPFRANAERQMARNRRAFSILNVFARLRQGVTREQASSEVDAISARFTRENPGTYREGSGFRATTLSVADELVRDARPMLWILLGTTGLVLLIACANVANLMLARLLQRDREFAVRDALGAGRGRLIRQLLTESTCLSVVGGLAGLAVAASTISILTTFVGRFTSRTSDVGIDLSVLGFTLLVSIVTGVAFGTFPALMTRMDLGLMARGGRVEAPARHRLQAGLVVTQIAVSVVLLIGAGLLLASFYRLQQVDPGYRAERVMAAEAFGNFSRYQNSGTLLRFYESVVERLSSEPGVVTVAVTNAVPLSTLQPGSTPLQIEGRVVDDPNRRPTVDGRIVSPNYFLTLGIPLVAGRTFTDLDEATAQSVAVINRSMMRFWDGADPIGSRILVGNNQNWRTVVGIVGDVKQFGLDRDPVPQVYIPMAQSTGLAGQILVRTSGDPASAASTIRRTVHAIDPDMPVENVLTLDQLREEYLTTPQLTAVMLLIFAGLALLVTMAGITGVIATTVSQRLKEFGLRMALGASRHQVLGQVMLRGVALVAIGLIVGLAGSVAATKVLTAYLFDTTPTDPITLAAVVVAFLMAGLIACAAPAWKATRVDPWITLRTE
jgi:predicted permease